jgi:hypothetical protein
MVELLTLDQLNRLDTTPQVCSHFNRVRLYYLSLARRVLSEDKEMAEIDRVDFVALYIKKYDRDVSGLDGKGMSIEEICNLYARAVVGHEDEEDVHVDCI